MITQQQQEEQELDYDLLADLFEENMQRLELEERLEELEKSIPIIEKYPLLLDKFNQLKEKYVDLHITLEKTTEYYRNQLTEQAALIRSNKGTVMIDCSNDTVFCSLVDHVMNPEKQYIYIKYVNNSVTKIE